MREWGERKAQIKESRHYQRLETQDVSEGYRDG